MPTQGASITVQGGLDLVSSSHALFRTPELQLNYKILNLLQLVDIEE